VFAHGFLPHCKGPGSAWDAQRQCPTPLGLGAPMHRLSSQNFKCDSWEKFGCLFSLQHRTVLTSMIQYVAVMTPFKAA